jgi:hypothetical protein
VGELLPDIVQLTGAQAVIAPIDNSAWLPPGLANQVARWLADLGVDAVFPKPLCSLTPTTYDVKRRHQVDYDNALIAAFAQRFGRPEFRIELGADGRTIAAAEVVRDAACGCARHVADRLARGAISAEDAEFEAGMLHHHYPCMAGMAIDPGYDDTLMHVSGNILKGEVASEVKPHVQTVYLRPSGHSG